MGIPIIILVGSKSVNLINNRFWSLINLIENAPDILANHAKHGDNQTEQKGKNRDDRREAQDDGLTAERIDENQRAIPETGQGNEKTYQ